MTYRIGTIHNEADHDESESEWQLVVPLPDGRGE